MNTGDEETFLIKSFLICPRFQRSKNKKEKNMSSKKSNQNLINAALYILIGVLLCIFRASVLDWAMTAIGIVLIAIGILNIVKKALAEGIIMAAIGVVVILGGWLFIDIILLILGVALLIKGVLDLVRAIEHKSVPTIVGSVITMVVGVMLVVSKWALLDWLFIIIGAVLIVDGVLMALGKSFD